MLKIQILKLFILFCTVILLSVCHTNSKISKAAGPEKVEDQILTLISKMTLEEKIGQMNQYNGNWDVTGPGTDVGSKLKSSHLESGLVGSMLNVLTVENTRAAQKKAIEKSRLGIPLLFGYDVIHGYKTIFPIPLAESCSWDMEAIETSARVAATESSAAGLHWTFAPMVDITRDARWGRVMEGAGEDPFLASLIAKARVNGFQGHSLKENNTIAACAKHFAGYGFAEGGRDYNSSEITDYTLHNIVLPPFKACVDAGIATFMNGFNELGGQPVTANRFLQRDLLKEKWGFRGFIVSDWGSIRELVTHGRAENLAEATKIAAEAGCDMDMESEAYLKHLKEKVMSGEISMELLDDAVERILRVKEKLGLFEDPFRYCNEERERTEILTEEHLMASRDVAKRSIVLLKNEGNLLPVSKGAKKLAVIGPLGDDKDSPLGSWRAQAVPNSAVSLLEGLKAIHLDSTQIKYAKGADLGISKRSFIHELEINQSDTSGFTEARELARNSDYVILALGEEGFQSGEGRSQMEVGLLGVQQALMQEIYAVNQNIILVLMNGRPLAIPWAEKHIPAILECWFLGSQSGHAIAEVLFGDYNPSGKLTMSFPRHGGQTPIYYNIKSTGRPNSDGSTVFWSHFTDQKHQALFPFGYGLSYSAFQYGKPRLITDGVTEGLAKVIVQIKNISNTDGEEIVQLYIQDVSSQYVRPVKELKAFQKLMFKAGEEKELSFIIKEEDLSYYSPRGEILLERGSYNIFVGSSSTDCQMVTFNY